MYKHRGKYYHMMHKMHGCGPMMRGGLKICKSTAIMSRMVGAGAFMSGLFAIGTFAIGRAVIKLLLIKKATVENLDINDLHIHRLRVDKKL